jgi:phospholipid/cholesterol/gamma-HCH transport system ATP-binding protein
MTTVGLAAALASARPIIRYEGVYTRFGEQQVHAGVSLAVRQGTVHFVIGESGVGKSVLIKELVGLMRPDRGAIEFDGVDVTRLDEEGFFAIRARCQMIFQQATLFDSMTVLENVVMPVRKRLRLSTAAARDRAFAALDLVHARGVADRSPASLGSGLRKQVAIARALALAPEVLLYDEPTTGLDPVAAGRTDRLIRETTEQLGLTAVVVSHDLASVKAIGDWVSFLADGKVRFDGPPAALFASADPVVRAFVEPHLRSL